MSSDLNSVVHRVQTLHTSIAKSLCPDGQAGRMVCQHCDNVFEIEPVNVVHYLRHGWPRCCGRTMRWELEDSDDRT